MTHTETTSPTTGAPAEINCHVVANGNGESIDTSFNGEVAREGFIESDTDLADYKVSSPNVLLATHGEIIVDGQLHHAGELLTMPLGHIHLTTGDEAFRYTSRKVSQEVLDDTEDRLTWLINQGIGDTGWWKLPRAEKFARLEQIVGHTSFTELAIGENAQVLIKNELDNPSGSHYDRAYLRTLQHFEEIGFTKPGDELRDISSGSAGISLALMSYLLGYRARIMVPSELPANRLYPMLHYGAILINTGSGYVPHSSIVQGEEILAHRSDVLWLEARPADRSGRSLLFTHQETGERICYLNHSENELSPLSFGAIADEIIADVPDITHVALAEGNWTTIAGIVPRLRELASHEITVIGYSGEVSESGTTVNYGTNVPNVPLRFKDPNLLDSEVMVRDADRDAMQIYAAHLGRSSLMGLAVAQQIIAGQPNACVVTIGYDNAKKY